MFLSAEKHKLIVLTLETIITNLKLEAKEF